MNSQLIHHILMAIFAHEDYELEQKCIKELNELIGEDIVSSMVTTTKHEYLNNGYVDIKEMLKINIDIPLAIQTMKGCK